MDFGNEVEWALFKGIEQEGPNKGNETLFVVGDVPLLILDKHIAKNLFVYFGAGGRFDFNPSTVKALAHEHLVLGVTIESPNYDGEILSSLRSPNSSWVIPYMWHSKPIEKGIQVLSEIDQHVGKFWKRKIWAKADLSPLVFMHSMADTIVNSYMQGYSSDTLLAKKDSNG